MMVTMKEMEEIVKDFEKKLITLEKMVVTL